MASNKDKVSRKQVNKRCKDITGKQVVGSEYPGGKSRESWRLLLDGGETLIATRRDSSLRAELEIKVLEALGKHPVPSPKIHKTKDWKVFFQEDLDGERLTKLIMFANEAEAEQLLDEAINGLAMAQQAGSKEGLDLQVPIIGAKKEWIYDLLERPFPLAKFFKEPAPVLDMKALYQLFRVRKPRFIKWDSRPGNANLRGDGTIAWFDWEHAGARNRLDDLAWLLGDEFVPNYPEIEKRLIDKHLSSFADDRSHDEALNYLMIYGTFHMLVRLDLIMTYKTKGDKKWWNIDYCIQKDKIGITLECAERTCSRAARWAKHAELTQPLVPLFEAMLFKMKQL
jgi:hypothetical protein